MVDFLNTQLINRLERSLDAASLRQQVISNNVANVDTPGFKRSTVQFESLLQQEIERDGASLQGMRTHEKHFRFSSTVEGNAEAVVETDSASIMNNNKNNVDMDMEMSLLAKNQLRYNMLIEQMSHEFKSMRTAIGGR